MRKSTGISKDLWNNIYVHKVKCNSSSVLIHALFNEPKDFFVIADYGANLELELRDFNGDISTVKDFAIQQFKESSGRKKTKWYKIHKYLKKHKVKGCNELPHFQCTTPDISKVIW